MVVFRSRPRKRTKSFLVTLANWVVSGTGGPAGVHLCQESLVKLTWFICVP